jgi:hypothetical protein
LAILNPIPIEMPFDLPFGNFEAKTSIKMSFDLPFGNFELGFD